MGEDYSNGNYADMSFAGRSLVGANFSFSNLIRASFAGANVKDADFSYSNLAYVDFRGAQIVGARFRGANLAHTHFDRTSPDDTHNDDQPNDDPNDDDPAGDDLPGEDIIVEEVTSEYGRIMDGEFAYENNMWNKAQADLQGFPSFQCVRKRELANGHQLGWRWVWPDQPPAVGGIYAYPEAIFGRKPWGEGNSTTPLLPAPIAQLNKLTLAYEIEMVIESGGYNLAPEVWITDTGASPQPAKIRAELMIWLDHKEATPAGRDEGRFEHDGLTYDVFYKPDMSIGGFVWPYITYRARVPQPKSGRIVIADFVRHAIAQGYVNPAHFISSVEFGNEIASGRGHTWVKRLSVTNT